ncbi:hypothetical protein WA026_001796 [Henosepilachna vigintioctopunctata]|uniref:Nucleoporin NUP42 n=1 Tax=Henosepilachna vigintioctopunctata TaxID=420089 RepID=A0AAW1USW2_9CUCU
MVVCKFFLQGECKFGENCRFDHQFPNGNISGVLQNQQPFHSNQNQVFVTKPANEVDTNTLITSVHNDMVSVEKSGQWLLTCYAPFKEKALFPGFEDQSFEEIRLAFYEAQKTNSSDQYKQQLQQALIDAKLKFKALQNPTKEIVEILRNIYNAQLISPSNSSSNQNLVFGSKISGQSSNNVFGQNTPPQVGSPNSSTLFGQNVGNNSTSQVFGQTNVNQNTTGIFGQPSKGSLFGNNNVWHSAPVFGSMVPYESNYLSSVRKIKTVEGSMFYSPYSFEENRFYFLESCKIFENMVQNMCQTEASTFGNPFEVEENTSEIKENPFENNENIMPVDIDAQPVFSNPFRAKSSYFKQNQSAAEKLGSLLNEFCLNNSTKRKTQKGETESNWLLKYIIDLLTQMRKEHDRLSFKVKLLSRENRIFRDEINNLKCNERLS